MANYVARIGPLIKSPFRKWAYNASGFNKYGLMHNDCYADTPDVVEAVKRLPTKLLDERNYRIYRALHLSMCHRVLPEKEWIKWDEDVRYLDPYLDEVKREREEREEWENNK